MQSKNYIIDGDSDGMLECNFFSQLKNMLTEYGDENSDTKHTENEFVLRKKTKNE